MLEEYCDIIHLWYQQAMCTNGQLLTGEWLLQLGNDGIQFVIR